MTSNQVMNSLGMNIFTPVNSVQTTAKNGGLDFQSFMNNSKKEIDSEVKTEDKKTFSKMSSNSGEKIKSLENVVGKETKEMVAENEPDRLPEESEVESVIETVAEIVNFIAELLEVTEEEITEALEKLGLDEISILNPANSAEIVMELNGVEEKVSLVTDGNLLEQVEELEGKIQEMLDSLSEQIDVPDLKEALESLDRELPAKSNVNASEVIENEKKASDENLEGKLVIETKEENNRNIPVETEKRNENGSLDSKTDNTDKLTEELPKEETRELPISFAENLINRVRESFLANNEKISYTTETTENILNQITESIKVQISLDNTEVNMKLHPETLGNVNVKISANSEGTMTAQFTAQNESVKAVLESQILVLKESLEAKGINIEAVEVMVGSHEFDENLAKNENRNGKTPKKSSIRKIDLSALEETEELNEDEMLQKEMMKQNGNTIDYTA